MPHVAAIRGDDPQWPHFARFVSDYGRDYTSNKEVNTRFNIFKLNMARAAELSKANPRAEFGVNLFSDIHPDEFAQTHLMPANVTEALREWHQTLPKFYNEQNPVKHTHNLGKDWSYATTAVKDQGQCGSCWAFSATEAIESSIILRAGSVPTLAPQQIVDCDTQMQGCNGGDPRQAIQYVNSQGGLMSEASYPYQAIQGSCRFDQSQVAGTTGGAQAVADGNEQDLIAFVKSQGPPSVCVDASTWQTYRGGVIDSCGSQVNHAVQAIGISDDGSTYTVRNSWSSAWGEGGMIRIPTNQNMCMISSLVSWAT